MLTSPVRSAVVVGGGVGGLGAGLALQCAGWDVVVHERSPALGVGAGLVLWPNAVHCLAALDLAEEVQDAATVLLRSGLRRPDGRWLSRLDAGAVARRHGAPVLGVRRADLVGALAGALRPGTLRIGSDVGPRTDVSLGEDGGSGTTVGADLVVGADGIRSGTRRAVWPDRPPPGYRGYTAWRALVPGFDLSSQGASETWGRGERFGVVPVGSGDTYVYATANLPEGATVADDVADLRARFGSWHAPIPALLDALDEGSVLRHDVHDLTPRSAPSHRGSTVLVGDAAHAMEPNLGQGACLALEDAVVLAHCLAGKSPVPDALATYSEARGRRVAALGRQSRLVGRWAQAEHRAVVTARDVAVRLTPRSLATRGSAAAAGWLPPSEPGTRPAPSPAPLPRQETT